MGKDIPSLEDKIRILWDHHEIDILLNRYCHGFDRCDMETAKGTHWPDAKVDYPGFVGPASGMCDHADGIHRTQFDSTQHYVTNNLVELDGDTAHAETYFIMAGRLKDSARCQQIGGRYVRRLERRDGEWRIAAAVCLVDWSSEEETLAAIRAVGGHAARDRSDPAYRRPLEADRPAMESALDLG